MSDGRLQYEITASSAGLVGAVNQAMTSIGGLSAKIAGVAGIGVLGGGAAGLGMGVAVAADREQVRVAMEGIIGDVGKAQKVMRELQKFASATPFEFPELADASRKLLSGGVATEDLIGELTALGNVAAAVGTDVGGLATIYTQIADKGKVYAEELMQFGERGAGAIKTALAESLGVSKAQLVEMVSEGKVSFEQFRTALQSLAGEGGKWGGMMAKQSQTTLGLFSTLKDTANELMQTLGQPINDAIKPVLNDAIGLAEELKPMMQQIGNVVANMITAIRNFVAEAMKLDGTMMSVGFALSKALADAFDQAVSYAQGFSGVMIQVAVAFGQAMITALNPVIAALKHGLASAALHAASVMLYSLGDLPGIGGNMQAAGLNTRLAGRKEGQMAEDAISGNKVFGAALKALEGFGDDISKAAADARDIFRGGKPGDNMQVGQMPEGPNMEPKQMLPNTSRSTATAPATAAPAAAGKSLPVPTVPPMLDDGTGAVSRDALFRSNEDGEKKFGPSDLARESRRSEDMAAAGGGSASGGSGRRKISGANAEKRANWKQREWQRMGAGARAYFSSSMYGGASPEAGAMENRTNDAMGRGRGSSGGRERRNTTDAASTQAATSTNLLNAVLQEIRKMNQHLSTLKSS